MIELDVEKKCENCANFQAEQESLSTFPKVHKIRCKNRGLCDYLENYYKQPSPKLMRHESKISREDIEESIAFKDMAVMSSSLNPPRYCFPFSDRFNKFTQIAKQVLELYHKEHFENE